MLILIVILSIFESKIAIFLAVTFMLFSIFFKSYYSIIAVYIFLCTIQISINFGGLFKISFSEVLIPLFLIYLMLSFFIKKNFDGSLINKKYLFLIIAFIAAIALSLAHSTNMLFTIKDIFQYSLYTIGSFFVTLIIYKRITSIESIINMIVKIGILLSMFGIIQWLSVFFLNYDILSILTDSSYVNASTSSRFLIRVASLFEHYNVFATFLIIPVLLSLYLYTKHKNNKYIYFIIILLISVWLSNSRSVIISILIGSIVYLFLSKKWKILISFLIFFVGFIIFIILINPSLIFDRFTVDINSTNATWSVTHRQNLWAAANDMFQNNFFTGIGLGNFPIIVKEYGLTDVTADSLYMTLIAETGFLGIFFFSILLLYILKSFLFSKDLEGKIFFTIVFVQLVNGILQPPFIFMRGTGFIFWFLINIGMINIKGKDANKET